jgi:hypothetical protein
MVQRVAQLFGVVFILVGLLGFVLPSPLLGLFMVNTLHNCVHILFGLWGLVAGRSVAGATTYCRVGGGIYILLALLGVVSPTGFGFVPLGGADVALHAVLGVALLGASMMAAKATSPAT